jgi:hypothetical protein
MSFFHCRSKQLLGSTVLDTTSRGVERAVWAFESNEAAVPRNGILPLVRKRQGKGQQEWEREREGYQR